MTNNKRRFESDNLIYNRFDMIYSADAKSLWYEEDGISYEIMSHCDDGVASINTWGKDLPDGVMHRLVNDIFQSDKKIYAIDVTRGRNQVKSFLQETNDIRVPLPDTFDELMNRAERRDRATIRRKLRWLDERVGSLIIDIYSKDEIPDSIVELYFDWKSETHGTEYGLSPREYIDKYYVSDAMLMKAGEVDVAVAFFCQVEDIVFFENFSYNSQLKEYSPGLLMYVKFMEELINRKCKYMYLGGGGYVYKKRFGSESFTAYSGMIYRSEIVDDINSFFEQNSINDVAFYGYGVCGHEFYQLSKNLDVEVLYGIDRNTEEQSDVTLHLPDAVLPKVDAVLITLNNNNQEVESLLKGKFDKVFYWNDILRQIISDYRRRADEGN